MGITEPYMSKWLWSIGDSTTDLTFWGVFGTYEEECTLGWNKKTTRDYIIDYNEKILPNLPNHNRTLIRDYAKEDYMQAIANIIKQGSERTGEPYAEATIRHYRHLIEVVVNVAVAHGLCDDVLWGSSFSLPIVHTDADEINERVTLRKSLTVKEEFEVSKALLSDPSQSGQEMGLLLMFALGLRNQEACGVNYGDIMPMSLHSEAKTLWIYKTTQSSSNTLQSSGKTPNADRVIPVPEVLAEFLEARRNYLIDADGCNRDELEQLPIACVGHDYTVRSSSSQLTAAGREMFKKLKMKPEQLSYVDAELSDPAISEELHEKDPSAYLFRRNFGTHLSILGLTASEIEYIIGHDIEDSYETRNEFVNEERLYKIKLKLDQRPIFNKVFERSHVESIKLENGRSHQLDGNVPKIYQIPLKAGQLKLHITANEPLDAIRITNTLSSPGNGIEMTVYAQSEPPKLGRTINNLKRYHERYRRVEARIEKLEDSST